ncbi:MAG: SDR family oxidoreductase [Gemmatimonadota bacterium]
MPSRIAFVTGATEGIGRAIAFELGRAGYAVGVCARTATKLTALVDELRDAGIRAAGRPADVANPEEVLAAVRHTVISLGPIDTLINNAGILIGKPLEEMTVEEWDRTFATNVRGIFLVTKAVLPDMKARGRGDIVNIASLAGKNGVKDAAAYSASKHAVLGFSRSLLLEVRPHGIRVIAICPGSVDTPLIRNQTVMNPKLDRILKPEQVAQSVAHALALPAGATVSELDIRPSNP